MMNRSRPNESGNVFFIIFLAIALFAGLSYAVFSGSRTSATALSADQAKIAAQEIISYADSMQKAVQTLKLRGCTDAQFDFTNSVMVRNNGALSRPAGINATADTTQCAIYTAGQGNFNPRLFPVTYTENASVVAADAKAGTSNDAQLAMPGIATSQADLILIVPYIGNEICKKINEMSGVQDGATTIPNAIPSSVDHYDGTYLPLRTLTDPSGKLSGISSYCAYDSTAIHNRFYAVLIAR